MDKEKLRWEQLVPAADNSDIVTWRARVPGGWLVTVWAAKATPDGSGKAPVPGGSNWGGGLTFVPFIDWNVEVVGERP